MGTDDALPNREDKGMNRSTIAVMMFMIIVGSLSQSRVFAMDDNDFLEFEERPKGYPNLKTWTQGGKQFWTDVLHFRDWRIQKNVLTRHFRLLDGSDLRHAWGNYTHCVGKLEEIKREQSLEPQVGKAVFLLHGLGRSRASLDKLAKYLKENTEYNVYNVSYASTRSDLATHAKSLDYVIRNLEGLTEINFVGHSLGNLVVRHYLADHTDEAHGIEPDARINRIVMMGPPNNGAQLARQFKDLGLIDLVWGSSGKQLSKGWADLEKRIAVPNCQFGIIAGGGGGSWSTNPLIQGDDDLVVSVEETRLVGASDFLLKRVAHTFMMDDPEVMEAVKVFLEEGYFVSEDKRQPITEIAFQGQPIE